MDLRKFSSEVGVTDLITCVKNFRKRFRDVYLVWGQKYPITIDKASSCHHRLAQLRSR